MLERTAYLLQVISRVSVCIFVVAACALYSSASAASFFILESSFMRRT